MGPHGGGIGNATLDDLYEHGNSSRLAPLRFGRHDATPGEAGCPLDGQFQGIVQASGAQRRAGKAPMRRQTGRLSSLGNAASADDERRVARETLKLVVWSVDQLAPVRRHAS